MRSFLLLAAACVAFAATMTFEATDANAVVCAVAFTAPAAPAPAAQ